MCRWRWSAKGADELFGGYPTYIGAGVAERFARLPAWLRVVIRRVVESLPVSDKKMTVSFLLKRFVQGAELGGMTRHELWMSNITPPILHRLGIAAGRLARRMTPTAARCWTGCNAGIWKISSPRDCSPRPTARA